MTTADQINEMLNEKSKRAEAATPEWWPRHPCGGLEIFPNSAEYIPIARFTRAEDCALAIADRADVPALIEVARIAVKSLESADFALSDYCDAQAPRIREKLDSILAILKGNKP